MADPKDPRTNTGECRCALCGRKVGQGSLTRHHLFPRSRARKMKRRKKSRKKLRESDPERTVGLCKPCHRKVHTTLSNTDLQHSYSTVASLKSHPEISRFVEWVRRKPNGCV